MLTCHAGGLNRAQVRAWLDGHAPAYISLYRKRNEVSDLLASNPSSEERLEYKVPPEVDLVELFVRVANEAYDSQPHSVYLEISQNDEVLPIYDGDSPVNGQGPYHALRLTPDAPYNKRKRYYFNVRFS